MFEGKPPSPDSARQLDSAAMGSSALRPLSWDELLARLAAARELRAELSQARCEEASFHAHSARRIAGLRDGECSINPDDLGNRKGNGLNEGASAHNNEYGAPRD